jgi:hypothetical protein
MVDNLQERALHLAWTTGTTRPTRTRLGGARCGKCYIGREFQPLFTAC